MKTNTNTTTTVMAFDEILDKGFWATVTWTAKAGIRTVGRTLSSTDNAAKAMETWSSILPQQAEDNVRLANTRRSITIASKLAKIQAEHDKLLNKLGKKDAIIDAEDLDVRAFLDLADEVVSTNDK